MPERAWRKGNPCALWVGMYICIATEENSMEVPQKNKNRVTISSSYPDKILIQKDTCTPMFIAALFTIIKTWKQPKCASTNEWIKKMWYIYIYIYNGILLSHKKE